MRTENIEALEAAGFIGLFNKSLSESLVDHGMGFKKDRDFIHFVYDTDTPSVGYSFGILDTILEDEFFWITPEQWHKIARFCGIEYTILTQSSAADMTFYVYDYFGAEPIFGKPHNKFMIRMDYENGN